MSNLYKLRKTKGNLWLASSFFLFTIAICATWLIFLISWFDFLLFLFFLIILMLYFCSFELAKNAYYNYVGVSEKGINQCDAAELKKINGIIQLVSAFVFLALAVSSIWVFFIFSEFFSQIIPICVIIFTVFISFFISNTIVACNNFLDIKRLVFVQYRN